MGLFDFDFLGKSYKEYTAENVTAETIAMFPLNKVDKDIVKNLTSNAKFNKSNMVAVNFLDLLKNIDAKTNETERNKLWESYKQSHPVAAAAQAPAAQAPAAQPVVPVQAPAAVPVQERALDNNGPSGMGGGKRKGRKNKTTTKIVVAPAVKRRRRRKTIKVSAAAIDNAKPI